MPHSRKASNCRYTGVSNLEDDGAGNHNLPIAAHLTIEKDSVEVDFTDCPDQISSFMNSPLANTAACANVAVYYLSDDRQGQNDCRAHAIKVRTRKDSIIDCLSPMPVTGCTTFTRAVNIEAVLHALEKAAATGSLAS